MGYRLYIGKIPKEEYDKAQKMSFEYLVAKYAGKNNDFLSVYDIVEEVHEFGKYYDVDTSKYNPFFAKKEIQDHFNEHDFWAVDKEFLLSIIKKEHKAMAEWFEECEKTKSYEELKAQMRSLAAEWRGDFGICPYELDLDKPNLVRSWKRDYQIFDLIRIYKTFDFEKDVLVYYGW